MGASVESQSQTERKAQRAQRREGDGTAFEEFGRWVLPKLASLQKIKVKKEEILLSRDAIGNRSVSACAVDCDSGMVGSSVRGGLLRQVIG
jgi:hypothetical protein